MERVTKSIKKSNPKDPLTRTSEVDDCQNREIKIISMGYILNK